LYAVQYTFGPELEKQAREREEKSRYRKISYFTYLSNHQGRREAGVPANVVETSTANTEPEKSKSIVNDQKLAGEDQ
jgi:hypothetical protein